MSLRFRLLEIAHARRATNVRRQGMSHLPSRLSRDRLPTSMPPDRRSQVHPEQPADRQQRKGEVSRHEDLDLIGEEAGGIGVGAVRELHEALVGGWREEGEELEAWAADTHRHGERLDRDFADTIGVPVFAVVVVIAARHDVTNIISHLLSISC